MHSADFAHPEFCW